MPVLDVFDADAFTVVSLTKAVNQISHVPTMLSRMSGLVQDAPIRDAKSSAAADLPTCRSTLLASSSFCVQWLANSVSSSGV